VTQTLQDVINIHVWTGYFFAIIPVGIDWSRRSLTLAQHCFYQSGHGAAEEGCEVPLQPVERMPADQDLTFVRLFPAARETSGTPAHVVIKRDSKVEILLAKVLAKWDEGPYAVSLGVDDNLWLIVRIDGTAGWIHTAEDFAALGLQPSG